VSALAFIAWIAELAPDGLRRALAWLRNLTPDAAVQIDDVVEKIDAGIAPEQIAQAVLDLPKESLDSIMLRFKPYDNPSDAA